ncbi:MAG: alpha/beta hydrolase [Salibacteraceae bacterium]
MSLLKWLIASLLLVLIGINVVCGFHAYKFTHFSDSTTEGTQLNENSDFKEKLNALIFGVDLPKPTNLVIDLDFVEVDTLIGEENLELWRFDMEPSKGVIALFHGYRATKSSLWKEALAFYRMGFTVVLVDFRGSGNSTGSTCTLGYYEANDVASVFQYCEKEYPEQKVFLYGSSMGAAAIMRAISVLGIQPHGVILQSPFYSMLNAVKTRFELMHLPSFPSAQFMTFWGGWLNNFDAFYHNPIDYANDLTCPTLLIHGMLDNRVSFESAKSIYHSIPGKKEFGVFSKSGHESILNKEEPNWIYLVTNFMESNRH